MYKIADLFRSVLHIDDDENGLSCHSMHSHLRLQVQALYRTHFCQHRHSTPPKTYFEVLRTQYEYVNY
jgi:hypothetical protein